MEERFDNQARTFIFALLAVFILISARLWQLQILDGGTYSRLSAENAARTIPIIAPRGIIYDRYGKVLVSNRAILSAYLLPKSVDASELDSLVAKLSGILGVAESEIFAKLEKYRTSPFEPVLIKKNLPFSLVTKLEERKREFPGVVVRTQPVRRYPHGKLGVHLLGYVGEVAKDELKRLRNVGYKIGDLVGKDGVEAVYDKHLRGIDGGQLLEVDVYGKPIRTKRSMDPVPGKDMILTIDLELQKIIENSLKGKEGAIVVMDPRNGEILAMASAPNFDPNIFASPMEAGEWEKMDKRGHPFMNRALSVYPPGSIFKAVTLSAALKEEAAKLTEVFDCVGSFELGDRVAKCWDEDGHGELNILEGLVWSCDVVFYELGLRDGVDLMSKYSRGYGLGGKTGIDLPAETAGFIPTASWKKKTYGVHWVKGDSINMAIGQGFVQVTPLQMANLYAGIAVGERFRPRVVKSLIARDGTVVFSSEAEAIGGIPIKEKNLALLRQALKTVVARGTGVASKVRGMPAGGKTGTAENPGEPHAWFMCFAPFDKPEIVVSSFVAHGEHGDRVTAYIARDVLNWYKKHRMDRVIDEPNFNWKQYILHGPYRGKL
jgi:penicillin-binding protein 2